MMVGIFMIEGVKGLRSDTLTLSADDTRVWLLDEVAERYG